jgi:hypothetical protein
VARSSSAQPNGPPPPLTAGVDTKADLLFFFPTYTFKEPVLGAQAAFGMGWAAGHLRASADVAVTGPHGNTARAPTCPR